MTKDDLRQLLKLLRDEPGSRAELQQMVVPPELDALREAIVALTEAQRRTESRIEALAEAQGLIAARLDALAEAQLRAEERLTRLEVTVQALVEAQQHFEERLTRLEVTVQALVEAQQHFEERLTRLEVTVQALVEAQLRTEETVRHLVDVTGEMRGNMLEIQYERKAGAYFGPLLRRIRVMSHAELGDRIEGLLDASALEEVLRLDLIVVGQPRQVENAGEVWLAVEVSAVVDTQDVERATRRAQILRQAGLVAIPVVAGHRHTPAAEAAAAAGPVLALLNGRRENWEAALAAYAPT